MDLDLDHLERAKYDRRQRSNDSHCDRGAEHKVLDTFSLRAYNSYTLNNKEKMMSWNVYSKGRWIDTVWYTKDCDAEYVRTSLIDHDGYPYDTTVKAR